jgi:hypothetical protein
MEKYPKYAGYNGNANIPPSPADMNDAIATTNEQILSELGKRKKTSQHVQPSVDVGLDETSEDEKESKLARNRPPAAPASAPVPAYPRMTYAPIIYPIYNDQMDSLPPSGIFPDYSGLLAQRPISSAALLQSTYGHNLMKAFPFANPSRPIHSRHHLLQPLGSLPQYLGKKNTQNRAKRRCKLCSTHCSFYCEQCSDVAQGILICFCNPFTTAKKPCYFNHLDGIEGILNKLTGGEHPYGPSSSSSSSRNAI